MKKQVRILFLLTLVFLLTAASTIKVAAQGGNWFIGLGENSMPVAYLQIADSVNPDKTMAFTAVIDVIPDGTRESKLLLAELLAATIKPTSIPSLLLGRVNDSLELMEERIWSNVSIQEMLIPEMDAASLRTSAKIRIRLKAEKAGVRYGTKTKVSFTPADNRRAALSSAYRVKAGALPVRRIIKFSSMRLTANNSEQLPVQIEMFASESKQWIEWFLNGAAGTKKEKVALEMYGADMRSVLLEIDLGELEIVSVGTSYANNQQTPHKVTIGLSGTIGAVRIIN
ncbi:MAG: hypothetical protein KAX45_04915 [Chitinophagaceae bacterium]|nr:hypothetical protein [Chitinophagaceae bacterium]MBP6589876.1 hypothetical protein [Chitinophagaceae bacterium]MBP8243860.1 hypothetical protein [Chitinophagaceae bacterium]